MTKTQNIYMIFTKGLFISMLFFYWFNIANWNVDSWIDQTINIWESVILNWNISWFDDCDEVLYNWYINDWPRELTINPNSLLIWSIISWSETTVAWEYYIDLDVTWISCWDSHDEDRNETDGMILTINWWATNNAPTDITISSNNINENNNIWDSVWNFSTVDPDDPSQIDNYKYYLVPWSWDDDNSSFSISYWNLIINEVTDFETKSIYKIRVQTQDSSYSSFEKEFIININDLDETNPSVNAWPDQNITIPDTVTLNWTKIGFPNSWCDFSYSWFDDSGRVTIDNSWSLTWASFETNSFTWTTQVKIWLTMNVSSSQMTHDSCWKTWTYEDDLDINISEEWVVIPSSSSSWAKKKRQADILFENEESILNIDLILKEKRGSRNQYNIWWNNIWWEWHIEYEVLYSTWSMFIDYKSFTTKMTERSFFYTNLDKYKDIYFFKVRAFYKNKYSPWSNTLSITNKESLLKYFKITCKNCKKEVYFWDVFKTPDLLIEDSLKIKCINCKKKVWFYDIWKSKDLILEQFTTSCKTTNKNVNFNDIWNNKIFFINPLKVPCINNKIKEKKINFDALIE